MLSQYLQIGKKERVRKFKKRVSEIVRKVEVKLGKKVLVVCLCFPTILEEVCFY